MSLTLKSKKKTLNILKLIYFGRRKKRKRKEEREDG
jgi:hypothetical protein